MTSTPCPQCGCTHRAPTWATIREMAEQAPLADLTVAMAVYLNRIDVATNPKRNGGQDGSQT